MNQQKSSSSHITSSSTTPGGGYQIINKSYEVKEYQYEQQFSGGMQSHGKPLMMQNFHEEQNMQKTIPIQKTPVTQQTIPVQKMQTTKNQQQFQTIDQHQSQNQQFYSESQTGSSLASRSLGKFQGNPPHHQGHKPQEQVQDQRGQFPGQPQGQFHGGQRQGQFHDTPHKGQLQGGVPKGQFHGAQNQPQQHFGDGQTHKQFHGQPQGQFQAAQHKGQFPGGQPHPQGQFPGGQPHPQGQFPGGKPQPQGQFPGGQPHPQGQFPGGKPQPQGQFPGGKPQPQRQFPGGQSHSHGPVQGSQPHPQGQIHGGQPHPQGKFEGLSQAKPADSHDQAKKDWPPKNEDGSHHNAPFPSSFKLREEAPMEHVEAPPVVPAQPAFKITQPVRMQTEEKWPPKKHHHDQDDIHNEVREFIKPSKGNRDYAEFFAQNALPSNYPSYRAPPGTQHHGLV